MFNFSITVFEDAESGLTYLYFWGNSDTVTALGGYTLSFNLSYRVDGQWAALEPTAFESVSAWDLFDANLASGTTSAVSAEGLSLNDETSSIGLFRVLLPASVDASNHALLVWVNETGGDLVFDQNGDPIDFNPSLQLWDASLSGAQFVEINRPSMVTPTAASYTDTSADDSFGDTTGTLVGVGVDIDSDNLTYGLDGGTVTDGNASKVGTYGTLTVDTVTGTYVYTPNDIAIEGLKQDTSESFVVTVSDGISTVRSSFVVNLSGADDITTFSGALTASVADDNDLIASGTLTVADLDVGDSSFIAQSNTAGTYGTFSIGADGHWNYSLSNDSSAVNALVTGQSVTDSLSVVTAGGVSRSIDIKVHGSDDTPTLVNPIPDQTVAQDAVFSYTFMGSTFNDVDAGDTFTYTANMIGESVLPGWLSFNGVAQTFTGTPTNADVGYYDIVVTAHDSSNLTVKDIFRITVTNVDDPATGTLAVTGAAEEGGTLTASLADVSDLDGATTTAYQWQSSADGSTNWANLEGATAAAYAIAADQSQVGHYLRVIATTTDALAGTTAFTSDASQVANANDSTSGAVTISGTPEVSHRLVAMDTLDDADGRGAVSYQWKLGGVDITGATEASLLLTADMVGKAVSVVASYTDGAGTLESVASEATAAITVPPSNAGVVVQMKLSQAVVDEAHTLDPDGSTDLALADIVDAVIQVWNASEYFYDESDYWLNTGAQLISHYSDGTTKTRTYVKDSATATSGMATVSQYVFDKPAVTASGIRPSIQLTADGNLRYRYDEVAETMGAETGTLDSLQLKIFDPDGDFGGTSATTLTLTGAVAFDLKTTGALSGTINTLSAISARGTQTIEGVFTVSGDISDIANDSASTTVTGSLTGMTETYADGSYFIARGGVGSSPVTLGASDYIADVLLDPANFAGDDVFNIELPTTVYELMEFFTGNGADAITISGGDGMVYVDAGAGNDTITSLAGGHTLVGGAGNDTILCGEGTDVAVFAGDRSLYTVTWSATDQEFTVTSSAEGTDKISGVETFRFTDRDYTAAELQVVTHTVTVNVEIWDSTVTKPEPISGVDIKDGVLTVDGVASLETAATNLTLTPSKTASTADKSQVNLLDAIAILKSIVGLTSLNPNQQIAANFDGNAGVDLNDAIGILKHVVGLPSATPKWVFTDSADAVIPASGKTISVSADTTVALTGILVGDVDGSWAG